MLNMLVMSVHAKFEASKSNLREANVQNVKYRMKAIWHTQSIALMKFIMRMQKVYWKVTPTTLSTQTLEVIPHVVNSKFA